MRISDKLASVRPFFSFEFFPPKDDAGSKQLFTTIETLVPLRPAFVSITYGAGGSTRARTVALAKQIQNEIGLTVVAHVTCVGSTRAELRALFDDLARAGIQNVLALRGDPPKGETAFVPPPGGFAYATELIAMLKRNYDFCIGAACYPEKHVEAQSMRSDLDQPQREGRGRRRFPRLAAVLRQREVFRVRAGRASRRDRYADRSRPDADHELRADSAFHRDVRRHDPAQTARRDGFAQRRCARSRRSRRFVCRHAGDGIAAARIAGHPFLHAQSLAGNPRRRLGDPGGQHLARPSEPRRGGVVTPSTPTLEQS